MIRLLHHQIALCIREIRAHGRQARIVREAQRITQIVHLVAHGRGLELLDPFEAVELVDRLQRPIQREAQRREIVLAELRYLRQARRGARGRRRDPAPEHAVQLVAHLALAVDGPRAQREAETDRAGRERRHEHVRPDERVGVAHRARPERRRQPGGRGRQGIAGGEPQKQSDHDEQHRGEDEQRVDGYAAGAARQIVHEATAGKHETEAESLHAARIRGERDGESDRRDHGVERRRAPQAAARHRAESRGALRNEEA